MFQPTNPSFIETLAEVSLDRDLNETEEQMVARHAQPYRERNFPGCAPHLLETLARWLATAAGRSAHPSKNVAMRQRQAISE